MRFSVIRPHLRVNAAYAWPMRLGLECVPNVSEGRDPDVLAALRESFNGPARLLDVHIDADHHRSVFTLAGTAAQLVDTLVAGVEVAVERIDLRRHTGAHPRVGSVDVVPFVPLMPEREGDARDAALALADQLAQHFDLPSFFYGSLTDDGREPAFFRRGGDAELARRLEGGEIATDRGPSRLHPTAGGVLIGVRRPLIAFNVNLRTTRVEVAREIAAVIRERNGGLPGVRALGVELPTAGLCQVSMNLTDWEATPPHIVFERVADEAGARGVEVAGSELVGLMPLGAAAAAAGRALGLDDFGVRALLEPNLEIDS